MKYISTSYSQAQSALSSMKISVRNTDHVYSPERKFNFSFALFSHIDFHLCRGKIVIKAIQTYAFNLISIWKCKRLTHKQPIEPIFRHYRKTENLVAGHANINFHINFRNFQRRIVCRPNWKKKNMKPLLWTFFLTETFARNFQAMTKSVFNVRIKIPKKDFKISAQHAIGHITLRLAEQQAIRLKYNYIQIRLRL